MNGEPKYSEETVAIIKEITKLGVNQENMQSKVDDLHSQLCLHWKKHDELKSDVTVKHNELKNDVVILATRTTTLETERSTIWKSLVIGVPILGIIGGFLGSLASLLIKSK